MKKIKDFYLPDYNGGSIVNLMSSISQSFGVKSQYKPLKIFPGNIKSKNVVLLVIDGLGYEYLRKSKSFLNDYLVGEMTSTFLPTTACAAVSLMTGVAPQQHGLSGWYMFFKELGVLSLSLPFSPKYGGRQFSEHEIPIETVFDEKPFQSRIKNKAMCFTINPRGFLKSDFNRQVGKDSEKLFYNNLEGFFRQIKRAISSSNRRKYIYCYWGNLDGIAHKKGIGSRKARSHFNELNKKLKKFIKGIKGTDTTLIITSDHGLVDTSLKYLIKIGKHPGLRECLTLPFCGDARTAYCYVHSFKTKQFEKYVKTKLNKYVWMFKSEDLINKNYYGLGKPNPKLFDRVGDYVLVCKENYAFDNRFRFNKKPNIGHHGGVSKEEMIVPLVLVDVD
ncbi:MAG: alkaline phosphatase family protein [archaeon]